MKKLGKEYSGVAGEYFVAAELTRHGFLSAITLRNSNSIDILASNERGEKQIAIQVKTAQGKMVWPISKRVEEEKDNFDTNKYYVFVSLPNDIEQKPNYIIVKSNVLGKFIATAYLNWLHASGKNRKDTSFRQFDGKWVLNNKEDSGIEIFENFKDFLDSL